ncbi:UNVERIFIED_CONTAM: Ribosomal RNA small subunit methyltransferase NEP1 [Sesamum angustifolium]|uniref:Ribosomal RNA small subunit methyltransferase NEP1 n=1 Tax=Sesamum angustifolium TaxID=2727405 RepID=A0AAW2NXT3_9LAMI
MKKKREHLTRQVPVESHNQKPMISFILHNAAIRKAFIKKKWVVANGIDDEEALLRQNKNPNDYMSQIAHVALKAILDSPLNKYGLIGAIYVKIADGALFEVKPHVRIPRTLPRFSGLMLELLQKSRIRTNDTNETLMSVIQEPITRHLPANSRISRNSGKLVDLLDYVNAAREDVHLVFMVGISTSEEINQQQLDDTISGGVSGNLIGEECLTSSFLNTSTHDDSILITFQ